MADESGEQILNRLDGLINSMKMVQKEIKDRKRKEFKELFMQGDEEAAKRVLLNVYQADRSLELLHDFKGDLTYVEDTSGHTLAFFKDIEREIGNALHQIGDEASQSLERISAHIKKFNLRFGPHKSSNVILRHLKKFPIFDIDEEAIDKLYLKLKEEILQGNQSSSALDDEVILLPRRSERIRNKKK